MRLPIAFVGDLIPPCLKLPPPPPPSAPASVGGPSVGGLSEPLVRGSSPGEKSANGGRWKQWRIVPFANT